MKDLRTPFSMMGVLLRGTPSSSAMDVATPSGMVPSSTMVTSSEAMASPILSAIIDLPLATLSPRIDWMSV